MTLFTVAAVRYTPPYKTTDKAQDFRLGMDGISRWPAGTVDVKFAVNTAGSGDVDDDGYIDSDDVMAALAAVDAGFNAWEIAGFTYSIVAVGDTNPCGGTSSVSWAAIDGTGGILGKTNVCRNPVTKEIEGFTITFDSSEDWSNSGAGGQFDLQAMVAHEAGHVTGLDHIHDSEAKRLTMFFSAQTGNRGPRTLGCGDRLGINALYGTTLDCTTLPSD
ncbi:MAG: matrixin family metalloprotease [Dehalococcoidia bacterium]